MLNKKSIVFFMLIIFVLLISCNEVKDPGLYAIFNTNKGSFTIDLFFKEVPVTVGNFVGLVQGTREFSDPTSGQKVKRPFYNGVIFHRIIKGFVIQGGDPLGNGTGSPGKDYWFPDEFDEKLKHDSEGVLSMANSGPDTNGSQFFITLSPQPQLDGRHTVFGKVIQGMDVVKKIENVSVDKNDKPYQDVYINSIKIVKNGKDAEDFDAEKAFSQKDKLYEDVQKKRSEKMDEFLKSLGVDLAKIITTQSGLKYFIKKSGHGNKPRVGSIITAHYAGYLSTGDKFDSSYDRGQPFQTAIGVKRVIEGWDEAFLTMQTGEKRVLILPSYLAYGENGSPPVIPRNATLIFDVELVSIN